MKHILISFIYIYVSCQVVFSQNSIENVLLEVEKNNTMLVAMLKKNNADKIGKKIGNSLNNPELGFNYLKSNPSSIGNRTDLSIVQTFDFPSSYMYKKQISDILNEQVDIEYQKILKDLRLQTRMLCLDLIYYNALKTELEKRLNHAEDIAHSFKAKFDVGETNILEYNKSQLNLLNIKKDIESIEIERASLLSKLANLNGGIAIEFNENQYLAIEIPTDFEQLYSNSMQNNPNLNWINKEITISQKQAKLNTAMSLPKIQAGYLSEKVIGEQFQGVTLGVSIPLWENRKTVKYAKANYLALESIVADNKLQFKNELETLHKKAISLQKSVNEYRQTFILIDNTEFLKKSLDNGEISLIDYMLELSIYYESISNLLEMERELYKTIATLNQYI